MHLPYVFLASSLGLGLTPSTRMKKAVNKVKGKENPVPTREC